MNLNSWRRSPCPPDEVEVVGLVAAPQPSPSDREEKSRRRAVESTVSYPTHRAAPR